MWKVQVLLKQTHLRGTWATFKRNIHTSYASGIFKTVPVLATCPTIPVPQGMTISEHFSTLSSRVASLCTSKSLLIRSLSSESCSPLVRKSEHLSAFRRMLTLRRILWQRLVTSRSLQISMTNSYINSLSSNCFNSLRLLRATLLSAVWVHVEGSGPKNVGQPSTVETIGLRIPCFSNSCAEIFLTGVFAPELALELDSLEPGSVWFCTWSWLEETVCVMAWAINHPSIIVREAFLAK